MHGSTFYNGLSCSCFSFTLDIVPGPDTAVSCERLVTLVNCNAGAGKADNELDVVFAVNMEPDFSDTVACDTPGEAGIDVDVEITFMVGLLDDSTVGVLMPPSANVGNVGV